VNSTELLSTYYRLLADRKYDEAVTLFRNDGDVLWSIPGKGPMAGAFDSKPAIEKALHQFHDGRFGEIHRPIHAFCVAHDGEHVCVQYLLRMVRGREICDIVAIDAWHVDGGSLAEVWTFFETLYDFDAWTGAAQ
jgi:ketosteroid isomerase-like protein